MRAGAGAADASTFITGLAAKKTKSASRANRTRRSDVSVTDSEAADDLESEMRDVVFDYEGSKDLVAAADDFL